MSRLWESLGHQGTVANARQVQLIRQSSRKSDQRDAHTLACWARVDPALLPPIRHRSEAAQLDLTQVRVRAALVEARTALVNTARGLAKALGERLPQCDADNLDMECAQSLPAPVAEALRPLLEPVASLPEKIHASDRRIEQIARSKYPETELLKQVKGVGTLIALTFVLRVEDPARFEKSREMGC